MADTTRLSLPRPAGTDLISLGDDAITELANTLDAAAMWAKGTFAGRPSAAALDGKFYLATDVGILYLSDGASWFEVSRGAAEVPLGGMLDYAGSADPADTRFLLADGRAISRATYAAAFALWSTTYGAGNGSTTFNIPDARGRGAVGPDSMGTAAGAAGRMAANNTRGASGGAETKTLATSELPSHTHGVGTLANDAVAAHTHDVGTFVVGDEAGHTHGVGSFAVGSEAAHTHGVGTYGVTNAGALTTGTESVGHTHSGTTAASFAGTANSTTINGLSTFLEPASGAVTSWYVSAYGSSSHSHTFTTGYGSASHTHTLAAHGHAFSGTSAAGSSHTHAFTGTSAAGASHTHTFTGTSASGGAHTHAISGSTAAVGGGTAFNQMAPYLVVNKIVRVL
jgi:microcystin-dependent protein